MNWVMHNPELFNKANTLGEQLESQIENSLNKVSDSIKESILQWLTAQSINLLSVVAIGIVGYIMFYGIKMMFFSKPEATQKVLFGYFILLLTRVFTAILSVTIIK